MAADSSQDQELPVQAPPSTSTIALTVALAALAAVGVGIAIQQAMERRLSKPEVTRLKFYRYLRERGRLES